MHEHCALIIYIVLAKYFRNTSSYKKDVEADLAYS